MSNLFYTNNILLLILPTWLPCLCSLKRFFFACCLHLLCIFTDDCTRFQGILHYPWSGFSVTTIYHPDSRIQMPFRHFHLKSLDMPRVTCSYWTVHLSPTSPTKWLFYLCSPFLLTTLACTQFKNMIFTLFPHPLIQNWTHFLFACIILLVLCRT